MKRKNGRTDIFLPSNEQKDFKKSIQIMPELYENRNADLIYDLYSNRMIPLKQTVNKYNRTIEMMHVKLDLINKAKSVLLDTIYLEYRPAIQIVKSKEIPADASDTLQYKILRRTYGLPQGKRLQLRTCGTPES